MRQVKLLICILICTFLIGCSSDKTNKEVELQFNENTSLRIPTMINKIDNTYYIVDCYNNNVIYNNELEDDLTNWYKIPYDFNQPHTIIGDGKFFIVVDTENNRLVTFRKENEGFIKLEEINNFGSRPHYGLYKNDRYYIWDGLCTMYEYSEINEELVINNTYTIQSLEGLYVRSFTYEDGKWYFPTANGKISVTDEAFCLLEEYNVPYDIGGLSYIYKIGEYWYLNVFTDANYDTAYSNLVMCNSLAELEKGNYVSLYEEFGLKSAPYYVNFFDDEYYMATLNGGSAIYRLDVCEDKIIDCIQIY